MSLLDTLIDTVKSVDFAPLEKRASSAYHSATSSANDAFDSSSSSARSAYHAATGKAKNAQGYAVEALHDVEPYFSRTKGEPDYLRGFVAGLIGGIVGTGIKMIVDRSMPTVQPAEEHSARVQVVEEAEKVADTHISRKKEEVAQQALNIGFGALVGGIYGIIAEAAPAIQAPAGVPFGAALWTLAHKIALPALGLTPSPLKEDVSMQLGQLGSHMAYGATVEMVRRSVRHAMDEENIM